MLMIMTVRRAEARQGRCLELGSASSLQRLCYQVRFLSRTPCSSHPPKAEPGVGLRISTVRRVHPWQGRAAEANTGSARNKSPALSLVPEGIPEAVVQGLVHRELNRPQSPWGMLVNSPHGRRAYLHPSLCWILPPQH